MNEAARSIIVSSSRPREDLDMNVRGTTSVMLAARDADVERIVHASSASVYGNPRGLLLSEDDVSTPFSAYPAGKAAAKLYCMGFDEAYKLPITILGYFNVYGKNQSP